MPQPRLSLRKIKEVFRLHYELGLRQRQIARCCSISQKYVALLNHPSATLISSLHYFTALLSEVLELKVSSDYWSYLSHKVDRLEQSWQRDAAVSFRVHHEVPQAGAAG